MISISYRNSQMSYDVILSNAKDLLLLKSSTKPEFPGRAVFAYRSTKRAPSSAKQRVGKHNPTPPSS